MVGRVQEDNVERFSRRVPQKGERVLGMYPSPVGFVQQRKMCPDGVGHHAAAVHEGHTRRAARYRFQAQCTAACEKIQAVRP